MNQLLLNDLFDYHPPQNAIVAGCHEAVREGCKALSSIINTYVPEGHEKDKAIDSLRETMYWANAGIATSHTNFDAFNPDGGGFNLGNVSG